MRFRTIRETVTVPHTLDGETAMVTETRERHVPVIPRDWDAVAVRGVTAAVLVLTLISITWSTTSIAHLLGGQWVSYLAAGVFDLSWLTALGLAYVARYRPDRRRIADRLSWLLMFVTVAAIFWHGITVHSVPLACVGGAVSVAAKLLWWATTRVTEPEMSASDRQWVEAQLSQAAAKMAVASARRQVARIEDRAAAELLALEESRRAPDGRYFGTMPQSEVPAEIPASPGGTTGRDDDGTEVPSEVTGPAPAPALPEPAYPGPVETSAGTTEDDGVEDAQVIASAAGPDGDVRHLRPVRGAATEQIRSLIRSGVTDSRAIRDRLAESGLPVPDASYIRRLIRQSRDSGSHPGQYL